MDNFDLRKYLVENKATTNSKMMNEGAIEATPEAISTYVQLMKSKFGANLGEVIENELYDEANMSYNLPEVWNDQEFAKFAKVDLELLADMHGVDVIDANFAKQVVAQALEAVDGIEKYFLESKNPKHSRMMNEGNAESLVDMAAKEFPNFIQEYGLEDVKTALEVVYENTWENYYEHRNVGIEEADELAEKEFLEMVAEFKQEPKSLRDLIEAYLD